MLTRAFNFCAGAAFVVCFAATAHAQQPSVPTFELSGGYQIFHVPDQTFPFGLNVDAARNYGALGLVGEVGFAYDSEEIGALDLSATAWNFGVGGRWTGFNAGRVWPFVQALVGAEVLNGDFEVAGVSVSDTATSFMVQPGVGVNLVVADGLGIVGQIDYRRTFFDEDTLIGDESNNQFRVFIGARMILD